MAQAMRCDVCGKFEESVGRRDEDVFIGPEGWVTVMVRFYAKRTPMGQREVWRDACSADCAAEAARSLAA